jgi:sulfur carrier protein ThiS
LDTAALEIVSLNQEINNLKQENQILRRNQKVIRSEWELEIVNVVGGLNGRKTLVLN